MYNMCYSIIINIIVIIIIIILFVYIFMQYSGLISICKPMLNCSENELSDEICVVIQGQSHTIDAQG